MNRKLLFLLGVLSILFLGGLVLLREHSPTLRIEGFRGAIEAAAREQDLDPALLAAFVYTESKGNPQAVSSSGAIGLMQIKKEAAQDAAKKIEIAPPSREDLFDPQRNLRLGAAYLKLMAERFRGDLDLGIMAYFVGPGTIDREIEKWGSAEAAKEALLSEPGGAAAYRTQIRDHEARFQTQGWK